jgi:CheY-like chemotaxis protein
MRAAARTAAKGRTDAEAPPILLVEDNEDHAEMVMRTLALHGAGERVHRARDGDAALSYLFRRGAYADPASSPRPGLILLDLRLPRVNGGEVLRQVKAAPDLRAIPVVVFTTSEAERDVAHAYENYANSYIVKPLDFTRFSEIIEGLSEYWVVWNRREKH